MIALKANRGCFQVTSAREVHVQPNLTFLPVVSDSD